MTISQILAQLPKRDHAALLIAFEEQSTYYVEFTPGEFIGVNTDACPHLTCTSQAGDWRAGTISRGSKT